jgi:hypothetical protein
MNLNLQGTEQTDGLKNLCKKKRKRCKGGKSVLGACVDEKVHVSVPLGWKMGESLSTVVQLIQRSKWL